MPTGKKKVKLNDHSADKLQKLVIGQTTPLRLLIWRVRRYIRDNTKNRKDLLDVETTSKKTGKAIKRAYKRIDTFMTYFFPAMVKTTPKKVATKQLKDMIDELGYSIVDEDENRPWGAYYRMANGDSERFIHEFFPGLSMDDAKLGHDDVTLSPKFLLISPGARLSWQFHHRRAERWRFLTEGSYYLSDTDLQGKRFHAHPGTVVQLAQGQRHRLCSANSSTYTLVAEIWQHTDPRKPSVEKDIVRLADDYKRDIQ